MTQGELYKYLRRHTEPIYGELEAAQIVNMIFEEMWGVSRMKMLLNREEESPISTERAEEIAQELATGRPVQYIIGEAEFCDMRFVVREGVLIPRPESEELIRWIVSESIDRRGCKVLDIGTGSGALAISLSLKLSDPEVVAVDISKDALSIASENIERLSAKVKLIEGDALRGVENFIESEGEDGKEDREEDRKMFDIIVSNPPYIPRSEESQMRINVTQHEPHLALFVPDEDPLIFYRAIARSAQKLLREGGVLYFEIHENFAVETKMMLHDEGYTQVEIRRDINEKERMICARR